MKTRIERFFPVLTTIALILVSFVLVFDIVEHNDSVIGLVIRCVALLAAVGIYPMVFMLTKLYKTENEKAHAQTREIEELNRAQSRFFSNMSHEIRTPINTIIGLNEMILREDVSPEVAEDAESIKSASNMLLSLINDILDMSKIESGNMEIVPVAYDAGRMLSELVGMIWGRATEKGLAFSIYVDPALPAQLLGDEVRIKQVLINLLNNAVKYTREGKITLSIHCNKVSQTHVLVTYSIEDTGLGIRKENIPYLFDAFRREDIEKNRYIEGSGLGLSIVKQLVDLMGGEISVTSIYTKGSTFTVSLEQEIADETEIGEFDFKKAHSEFKHDSYIAHFEAPDAHILIVDDNSANLMVVEKLLKATQVHTKTASSGAEALELTLQNHYDAILMDHLMPEMDGIECLHAIREQVGGMSRETPVIVLTANAGSEDQQLYKQAGFDAYLVKPIDSSTLEQALMNVLPESLVSAEAGGAAAYSSGETARRARRKIPLVITTDSVADLPQSLTEKLGIAVQPYKVYTDKGVFYDGIEAGGDVIIRYMDEHTDVHARSEAPDVSEYEDFFAEQLSDALHIIHVALGRKTSRGYDNASEAALSFYNVKVIDSGHLSSGMGLVVLKARELVESGMTDMDEIARELEKYSRRVQTSFIAGSTEYLYRGGRISERIHRLCTAFMLHPVLSMKDSTMIVGSILVGTYKRIKDVYIRRTLSDPSGIDTETLFITYAGITLAEAEEIKEKALKLVPFKNVYLQKASPAIASNSGAGTFGLLFARKM